MAKNIYMVVILFFLYSNAMAVWPFDNSQIQAGLICKNAARQAEHAAKSREMMTYQEWVQEFSGKYYLTGKGKILRREILRGIHTGYKNKDVKPETIYDMVIDECQSRKRFIIEEIENLHE